MDKIPTDIKLTISKIKKRDGRIVDFDQNKIVQVIFKAAEASRPTNLEMSQKTAKITFSRLEKLGKTFDPEEIEKIAKEVLAGEGYDDIAKIFKLTPTKNLTEERLAVLIFDVTKSMRLENREMAKRVASYVVEQLEKKFNGHTIPTVEDVQNEVEKALIEMGHIKTAKSYILYRQKRSEIRKLRVALGIEDDMKLPLNTLIIFTTRYLRKNENRQIIETPRQLFMRVSKAIAEVDKLYDPNANVEKTADEFFDMMTSFEFLPNSPTLMNAGTNMGQLSACFVVPVEDSITSIFDAIKIAALIHKSGGGTGFSFSKLRPKGDIVKSTGGIASGPISFMKIFDSATNEIKQGGKRRGANMGILRVDHPDILDFIVAKEKERILSNFNISVAITDKFMDAIINNKEYELINPRNKQVISRLSGSAVWNLIVTMAWKTGDPGVIFIDRINKTFSNPVPSLGPIESTNPCVVGDTLIPTEHGLMRMKDLVEKYPDGKIKIGTDNRVPIQIINRDGTISLMQSMQEGVNFHIISKSFCTGLKEVYKLVTGSGYELIATADHQVLTDKGWVELVDLDPLEHKVLIQSGKGKFSDNYELPFEVKNEFIGKNGRKYSLNLPNKWSKELGQVLGWLVGDGWLRDGDKNCRVGFTFSNEDREVLEYLKPIINNWYSSDVKEIERENAVLHLSYHSKYFADFFKKLGVKTVCAEEKVVPESIFTAPKEAVIGFLQGLFSADGTVNFREGHSSYVRLTSKSRELLKNVQLILLNLGIKSRIYDRCRKEHTCFSYVTTGGKLREYKSDGVCYELEISRESVIKFLSDVVFLCNKNQKKIEKFDQKGFYADVFCERIKEITPNGKATVYDLTEEKTLSFITNGLLSLDCGEQPLYSFDSCNLGSINLSKMLKDGEIDWDKLRDTVMKAVHFLDNIIDANKYPVPEIEAMTKSIRRIGLGVMGFADMLIQLGIPYNSGAAIKIAESIMKFITDEARKASISLAEERGSFPKFKESIWPKLGYKAMRNSTVTTIAPTGTISVIAGCSSGIEPLFAISYMRNVSESLGENLIETNSLFEKIAIRDGFYSEELMKKIAGVWSIQHIEEIPEEVRKIFVTAHDISPEWHVRMQAAFQKYTDNAVSKTINFPFNATPQDVEKAYLLAYQLGCKGITVYRDKSRENQVITTVRTPEEQTRIVEFPIEVPEDYNGGCETCEA